MKSKLVVSVMVLFLVGLASPLIAGEAAVEVSSWDTDTCEHTMTTDHLELAPGDFVRIPLNQSTCGEREGVFFFGYVTSKTRSRQLTSRDGIRLTVVDDATGDEMISDSGALFASGQLDSCVLYAENMNRRKSVKVRIRASVIW